MAYFIRGIWGKFEGLDWTDEAQYIVFEQTDMAADTYKYWSRLGANLFAGGRSELIAQDISEWQNLGRVYVAAHSHGCKLALAAAQLVTSPLPELALIAAATHRDCQLNGLNSLLASGRVLHATIYTSTNDKMLGHGGRWYGRMVGFGDLGRAEPDAILGTIPKPFRNRVTIIQDNAMGHSDWVMGDSLARIVRRLEILG